MGFLVEYRDKANDEQLYLDGETILEEPRALMATIEGSNAPLVRLGLWPDGAACALSITGNVHGASFFDFGLLR